MAPLFYLLLALQGTLLASVHAITLPLVTKKHVDVVITSQILTDSSRIDPFSKDGRPRSIVISTYTPVPNCRRKNLSSYMPPATSQFLGAKFGAYGIPNNTFDPLTLSTCHEFSSSKNCAKGSYPIVLFSPALGTSRLLYSNLLQNIASTGYFVLSVDHPYDADIVTFPNGTSIIGVDIPDSSLEDALATRVADMQFLNSQLSGLLSLPKESLEGKTAIIGHSFGGAAAASTLATNPSLRGGLNLDGSMFGDVLKDGISKPFLLLGHDNKTRATDPSWEKIWPKLSGWKRELEVKGTQHYAFSDLPAIAVVSGFGESPVIQQVLGTVEGGKMTKITTDIVVAFLDFLLKGDKGRGLNQVEKDFKEIVRVP